jgi:hypothetical protein
MLNEIWDGAQQKDCGQHLAVLVIRSRVIAMYSTSQSESCNCECVFAVVVVFVCICICICLFVCVFVCASFDASVWLEDEDVSTWNAPIALLSTAMMPGYVEESKEEVEDEDKDEVKLGD